VLSDFHHIAGRLHANATIGCDEERFEHGVRIIRLSVRTFDLQVVTDSTYIHENYNRSLGTYFSPDAILSGSILGRHL